MIWISLRCHFLAFSLCSCSQCPAGGSAPSDRRPPEQDGRPRHWYVLPVTYNKVTWDLPEDQPNSYSIRVMLGWGCAWNCRKMTHSGSRSIILLYSVCRITPILHLLQFSWFTRASLSKMHERCRCSSSTPQEWIQFSQYNVDRAQEAMQVSQQMREDTSLARAQVCVM